MRPRPSSMFVNRQGARASVEADIVAFVTVHRVRRLRWSWSLRKAHIILVGPPGRRTGTTAVVGTLITSGWGISRINAQCRAQTALVRYLPKENQQ